MTQPDPSSPIDYQSASAPPTVSDGLRLPVLLLTLLSVVALSTTLILTVIRTAIGAALDVPLALAVGALAVVLAAVILHAVRTNKRQGAFEAVLATLTGLEWLFVGLFIATFAIAIIRTSRTVFGPSADGFAIDWPWTWAALLLAALEILTIALKAIVTGDASIVLKQMRQRALGTWLTLLSVLLGVALAVAVLLINRESGKLFGQTDFGYELIIGPPKGSQLTLTLNTVYHMEQSEGVVPYSLYEEMSTRDTDYAKQVRAAVPFLVGDSYEGRRIVGTSPQMIGYDDKGNRSERPWEYRKGKSFELASGRAFHPKRFEAVLGSDVARELGMTLFNPNIPVDPKLRGEAKEEALDSANQKRKAVFQATHGLPKEGQEADVHQPKWRVVGILKPTGTANDKVLFIPVVSLYAIQEHSSGLLKQALLRAGYNPNTITQDRLPDILEKLGFEPNKIPRAVYKQFRTAEGTTPGTGPATGPTTQSATQPTPHEHHDHKDEPKKDDGGDLLRPTAAKPPAPKDDHDHDHDHHDHEHDAYHLDEDGNIVPDLPQEEWALSAILVKTRAAFHTESMLYNFKVINTEAQAASPARVMRAFFDTFLKGTTQMMLLIAALVSIVAAITILVSIYNSVAARQKEIAILRALGATRSKVLSLICLEAGFVGLLGGSLGLLAGHLLGAAGNGFFQKTFGEGIAWWVVDGNEVLYVAAVTLVAVLAGLIPALKAYRVPVVANLSAG